MNKEGSNICIKNSHLRILCKFIMFFGYSKKKSDKK